jgi:5-(carboxyamino)imidazole ribonucleotide synthase
MNNPLLPGSVIGILGGGQLGRMLSVAASRIGLKTHIFEPGANPPAGQVADQVTTAPYEDHAALVKFAKSVDVITYEFENIPAEALDVLENHRNVFPARNALATSQDRLVEKQFIERLGLRPAPYWNVESEENLMDAVKNIGTPSILKTRRFGYDGKGQARLSPDSAPLDAWAELGNTPCVLEGFIDFSHEISVIGARSQSGEVVCFDPGENVHRDGILHTTTIPANLSQSLHMDAIILTGRILNELNYVGVIGVELFVTPSGLIVNEFAPRVHNSGHWTQNGCVIDQFEQHIRAVAGWPLGDGQRHSDVVMTNLIGPEANDVVTLAKDANIGIHLYGKAEAKHGRKMGHTNKITGSA